MKKILFLLFLGCMVFACNGKHMDESDPMSRLSQADISLTVINPDSLITYEVACDQGDAVHYDLRKWQRPDVLGSIGDFDRFRIKFTKVEKAIGLVYSVSGVWGWYGDEGFAKEVKGTITLDSVTPLAPSFLDCDSDSVVAEMIHLTEMGLIHASVDLNDDKGNSWKGKATYEYVVVDGQYHYSTLASFTDGYRNNTYQGVMTTKEGEKVCNWGDFRIPGSGGHDIGCGTFSPQGGRGWENYRMIEEDSLLKARDLNWMMTVVRWQELDWEYERVLENCYLKLVDGKSLSHDDYIALMPKSSNQFWQFFDHTAHSSKDGYDRRYHLDQAVRDRMTEGDFEIMGLFLPALWRWSDGAVGEEMVEIDYQLWKKYPKEVEGIARKHDYLKSLKNEIELYDSQE